MKRIIVQCAIPPVLALLACAAFSAPARAQDGTTPGPVYRITQYKTTPGKMPEVLRDMREHLRPVYDEYKQQGLILDYKVISSLTTESPNDWDIGLVVAFKNLAAMEALAEKAGPITLKHYGNAEKRTEAASKRNQMRTVVSSRLVRELTLNPLP